MGHTILNPEVIQEAKKQARNAARKRTMPFFLTVTSSLAVALLILVYFLLAPWGDTRMVIMPSIFALLVAAIVFLALLPSRQPIDYKAHVPAAREKLMGKIRDEIVRLKQELSSLEARRAEIEEAKTKVLDKISKKEIALRYFG